MLTKSLAAAAGIALLIGNPASALNIVELEAPSGSAVVGETIDLTLRADFDDATVGGGIVLDFDPDVLDLDSVMFGGAYAGDPDFRCPSDGTGPVDCPATPNFVSFGSFAGLSGAGSVATMSMQAVGAGTTAVEIAEESPFASTAGSPLDVSFEGTTVNVVPEPGTAGLVGLGFAALGVHRARRRRR